MRLMRPRRVAPVSQQALSLWLFFAAVCAVIVIYIAVKANWDRAHEPIPGSQEAQQKEANQFREALERDSSDVAARIGLADILYDTGNWPEAIIHYRAAVAKDSTRTNAIVDLGVCYYNLGLTVEAEKHFQLALRRDPHQPVALFNLGIVNERRSNHRAALEFFHRALESDPPEEMRPLLLEAMQRVQQQVGRPAPPLPDGRMPRSGP